MKQAIEAYRGITATDEFKEMERLRSRARHNEASALSHARSEGIKLGANTEREKWQSAVADKDALIADKDALIVDKDALLVDKDALIMDKDALIAELRARLGE